MAPFRRDPEGQKPPGEFLLKVGWGKEQRQTGQGNKVSRLLLKGPQRAPADTQTWGLTQKLHSRELRNHSRPGQICLLLREHVHSAYCVPGYAHPGLASFQFGKTCPSCLLGQTPGQAAWPVGKTCEGYRRQPTCGSPQKRQQPRCVRKASPGSYALPSPPCFQDIGVPFPGRFCPGISSSGKTRHK